MEDRVHVHLVARQPPEPPRNTGIVLHDSPCDARVHAQSREIPWLLRVALHDAPGDVGVPTERIIVPRHVIGFNDVPGHIGVESEHSTISQVVMLGLVLTP